MTRSLCSYTTIPNSHIHGILYVREDTPFHLGQVIKGFKTGCNKSLRLLVEEAMQAQLQSLSPAAAVTPVVSSFQRLLLSWAATLSQHTSKGKEREGETGKGKEREGETGKGKESNNQTNGAALPTGLHLWEKGYNDKILFNYSTLDKWKAYLSDNPRRLAIRRLHPDYFRVRFGLNIAGRDYAAIGNRMLLSHPEIVQVQLSRHFTDEELAVRVESLLRQARHGAVLVSPAISKGEQMVMRRAMDESLPLIFITPWGFNTFSKPGHQYYEACAAGRLLMLAPWEHHNNRIPLTREMCLQLNAMAAEIAAAPPSPS